MPQLPTKADLFHNILLENREKLSITGVDDVNSFDEKQIVAQTKMGYLTIKGSLLHIHKFNQGDLNITGKIDELVYSKKRVKHLNFLERVFK